MLHLLGDHQNQDRPHLARERPPRSLPLQVQRVRRLLLPHEATAEETHATGARAEPRLRLQAVSCGV